MRLRAVDLVIHTRRDSFFCGRPMSVGELMKWVATNFRKATRRPAIESAEAIWRAWTCHRGKHPRGFIQVANDCEGWYCHLCGHMEDEAA